MIAALAGGVGAARFLRGLVRVVPPAGVTVVVNTGDDDWFHGLFVSPDLDTVTYTLAGAVSEETGWGLTGDTFRCVDALGRYGVDTWFRLGDLDLATHIFRTARLRAGAPLSEVTSEIATAWELEVRLLPMSDDPAPTVIEVRDAGGGTVAMPWQEWFVARRTEPPVAGVDLRAAARARAAPGVIEALETADAIVICPSNPVISIGPILAVPGVREVLERRRERVVAVSPIVGDAPVKGPADRLMAALDIEVSCVGVATHYTTVCSTLVIDEVDVLHADAVRAEGVEAVVAPTLMHDVTVAENLAALSLAALRR